MTRVNDRGRFFGERIFWELVPIMVILHRTVSWQRKLYGFEGSLKRRVCASGLTWEVEPNLEEGIFVLNLKKSPGILRKNINFL